MGLNVFGIREARFAPMLFCAFLIMGGGCIAGAQAQPSHDPGLPASKRVQDDAIEGRLAAVSSALSETQATLRLSMQKIEQLQEELSSLHAQLAAPTEGRPGAESPLPAAIPGRGPGIAAGVASSSATSTAKDELPPAHVQEEVEAMQAEIQQHEQTKIETASKYPLKMTGLLLLNLFANDGAVDNIDLPTIALPRPDGVSHGSVGGSVRQTIFGIDAHGPRLGGARTSASLSIDFFGDLSPSLYSSPNGSVQLRRARLSLDWARTTVTGGIEEPLISPLSPTSYAAIALPALSWAGNLWNWAPQLRIEQRLPIGAAKLHLEGGLLDPLQTALTGTGISRTASPGELARQPAFEGRVSWHRSEEERALVFGMGVYTGQQRYPGGAAVHSWAGTADWSVPLSRYVTISGEAYRGRALAGLGGGAYKNVLTGIDPRSGLIRTNGVDAAGGWSQLTWRPRALVELNAAFGLDNALGSNFRRLQLTASPADPLQFYARNSMVFTNVVLRPKSYLILSPEYRRIRSWKIGSDTYDANVFTLSAGYQF